MLYDYNILRHPLFGGEPSDCKNYNLDIPNADDYFYLEKLIRTLDFNCIRYAFILASLQRTKDHIYQMLFYSLIENVRKEKTKTKEYYKNRYHRYYPAIPDITHSMSVKCIDDISGYLQFRIFINNAEFTFNFRVNIDDPNNIRLAQKYMLTVSTDARFGYVAEKGEVKGLDFFIDKNHERSKRIADVTYRPYFNEQKFWDTFKESRFFDMLEGNEGLYWKTMRDSLVRFFTNTLIPDYKYCHRDIYCNVETINSERCWDMTDDLGATKKFYKKYY